VKKEKKAIEEKKRRDCPSRRPSLSRTDGKWKEEKKKGRGERVEEGKRKGKEG